MSRSQCDPHTLLTRAKAAWQRRLAMLSPSVSGRNPLTAAAKPKVLIGQPLDMNAGDAQWYQKKLENLVTALNEACIQEVSSLPLQWARQNGITMDASLGSQGRIAMNGLRQRFFLLFRKKARELAAQMVFRADKASSASLHTSLKELSGGLSISTTSIPPALKEAVKATLHENARLIRSIAALLGHAGY